ncbi:MAG TPA: phosphotransferase [Vicinamibacterales bacterium]|nr:phosphotransferase [Vicinamibacterales bacterium]
MEPRLEQYLAEQRLTEQTQKVLPLTGDASDRRYFRVLLKNDKPIVLALHAGPIDFASMPFVSVARLLAEVPVPVPRILHHSDALGVLGLEDLGDVTLQAHLGAATPAEHAALYRQAVGFIARMQQRGEALRSDDYPPYRVAFDHEKLTWELEFFVKHYLLAYKGAALSEAHRDALRAEWAPIVDELASEPRVLCHRDYHSRNLMLHDGSLYIIDFQDARMGPDTYDLVSLLRDSYVDMIPPQVDELIAFFLAIKGQTSARTGSAPSDPSATEFRRRFDVMALQRNLKALGTFGYMTTSRNNTVYIQYIPRTVSYVKANLAKYPRFARLNELLDRWL